MTYKRCADRLMVHSRRHGEHLIQYLQQSQHGWLEGVSQLTKELS